MDHSQVVNVAIFGLSLRMLHSMREALQAVTPDDVYIQWTNITDPNLHWLMINEVFLESSNIQRLLQSKKVKLLKLTKKLVKEEKELYSFCLDVMDKQKLRHWVINNIYDMKVVSSVEGRKYQSLSEDLSQTDTDIKKLLAQISNPLNGKIKVFDRSGEIGLCDLDTQWVWSHHRARKTDQSLNFTHSTLVEILNQDAKPYHFKFWLWNLIWNSPELVVMPPTNDYFKLTIWPQPELGQRHREAFKMSAWFSKGGSIFEIAERLQLPIGTVQHFVAASLATGFIEHTERPLHHELPLLEQKNLPEDSGIRKFFSGLRRRLGL